MEVFLRGYERSIIVNIEVKVILGKRFNITVLIPDMARSTKGRRGMTITDLTMSVSSTRVSCGLW